MSYLTIKVNIEDWGIETKLASAADKAALTVAIQAEKDTRPFVPARNLSLANRTQSALPPMSVRSIQESEQAFQSGTPTIIYPGPYARYLYYGKLMVDPDTGSAWAKAGATKVLKDKNLVIQKTVNPQAQSHWFEASKAQNLDKWKRVAAKAVEHDFK